MPVITQHRLSRKSGIRETGLFRIERCYAVTCARTLLAVLFLVFVLVRSAVAEWIPPDKTEAHTPSYSDVNVTATPGTYTYDITWQGIPVASAAVVVEELSENGKKQLHVEAKVRSARGIALLYSLKHVSEALFETSPFRPVSFGSRQIENSRPKYRTVTYAENKKIAARIWSPGKTAEIVEYQPDNVSLDPISATFLAINVPLEVGKELPFDVFNGKHRFIITFHVDALDTVKIRKERIAAYRVTPRIQKLTDTEGEKKFNGATLWVANDGSKRVLRLESKVWIGSIVATFDNYAPVTKPETEEEIRKRLASPDEAKSFE